MPSKLLDCALLHPPKHVFGLERLYRHGRNTFLRTVCFKFAGKFYFYMQTVTSVRAQHVVLCEVSLAVLDSHVHVTVVQLFSFASVACC